MKKWLALGLALVLILVLWIGSYVLPVTMADCIVRVHYTGLAMLSYGGDAYYAICGNHAIRVSEQVLEQLAPKVLSGSKYGDLSSTQWFARLHYVPYLSYFQSEHFLHRNYPWLATEFGEKYRVYYHHWTGAERTPNEKEQQVLLNAAQTLHSGDIDDYTSSNGIERGLTYYVLISNGEQMLLQHEGEGLYRPMEDGTFELIMKIPNGGDLEYIWFP